MSRGRGGGDAEEKGEADIPRSREPVQSIIADARATEPPRCPSYYRALQQFLGAGQCST